MRGGGGAESVTVISYNKIFCLTIAAKICLKYAIFVTILGSPRRNILHAEFKALLCFFQLLLSKPTYFLS